MTPDLEACRHGVLGDCKRCELDPLIALDEAQAAAALEAALVALEGAGVPRTHVVLGFTNDPTTTDTLYETHLGRAPRSGLASLLAIVARDLAEEARLQGVALISPERCPACGSRRYGPRQQARGHLRVAIFDKCIDCGEQSPDR